MLFADLLRSTLLIDAARDQEHQLAHAAPVGGIHDVRRDHQVLIDELRRVRVVGKNAANLSCGEEDMLGTFLFEELPNGHLIDQIELGMASYDNIRVTASSQPTN